MQYSPIILLLLATLFFTGSCSEAPNYPTEPVITYEGLSKSRIFQYTNGPVDTIILSFSFTDGDGDLSSLGSDSIDIFLTDSRLPTLPIDYRFPLIPEEGTGNGISGTASIAIVNTNNICCIFNSVLCAANPAYPIDTFSYSIQIRDRANNFSNTIRSEQIEIICLN